MAKKPKPPKPSKPDPCPPVVDCDEVEAPEEAEELAEKKHRDRWITYMVKGGKNHNYDRWKIENPRT